MGTMIVLEMVASSFLPHQVRNTVGTLLKVGQGKMTVEEFESVIAAKNHPGLPDRRSLRRALPGEGGLSGSL